MSDPSPAMTPLIPAEMSYPVSMIRSGPNLSVAIIICTRNRNALLERCLRSICRLKTGARRVLVVDNAPDNDAVPGIAAKYDAEYLLVPQPGLSRARNRGARACDEDILAYVDDDMVLHPDWLSSLLAGFSDAGVAGVTGPFVPLEMENDSVDAIDAKLVHLPWGPKPFRIDRTCVDWFERVNFGGIGDGNFAVRRAVFDQWRGFDERLGRGVPLDMGEDHYAFFELLMRGHSFAYSPHAIVFHPVSKRSDEEAAGILAQSIAYTGFLALENPRYAPRIAKYLVEWAFGKKRQWRDWAGISAPFDARKIPPLRVLFAVMRILRDCYARKY